MYHINWCRISSKFSGSIRFGIFSHWHRPSLIHNKNQSFIHLVGKHLPFLHGNRMGQYLDVSKNSGFSPNHPLKNRVFHYFHHPFWGTGTTIFGNTDLGFQVVRCVFVVPLPSTPLALQAVQPSCLQVPCLSAAAPPLRFSQREMNSWLLGGSSQLVSGKQWLVSRPSRVVPLQMA